MDCQAAAEADYRARRSVDQAEDEVGAGGRVPEILAEAAETAERFLRCQERMKMDWVALAAAMKAAADVGEPPSSPRFGGLGTQEYTANPPSRRVNRPAQQNRRRSSSHSSYSAPDVVQNSPTVAGLDLSLIHI